ncbi:MAG: SPFH domain-containing protein [Candidatus Odinarchaeota archaeon]
MPELLDLTVGILFNPFLWGVVALALIAITIMLVFKKRYKVFPSNVFVIHIRKGKVRHKSFGGAFFQLPIVDQYFLLPTTIQRIEIQATDKVISRENQEIVVRGFLVWRVEDAEKAFQRITGVSSGSALHEINTTLEQLAESVIRTTVANMTLDEILRNRSKIVDELMKEFVTVVGTWGVSIETIEVKDVELINQELFRNLQAEFENAKALEAKEIEIQTHRAIEQANIYRQKEIAVTKAAAEREVRILQAEQEELAKIRELEKERKIIEQDKTVKLAEQLQQQEVQLASETRELEVGLLQQNKEREVGLARKRKEQELVEQERVFELQQKQKELEVMQIRQKREVEEAEFVQRREATEAETELIKKTKEAEAEKQRILRTSVEIDAERELKAAKAKAEAARTSAAAEAEAQRTRAEAEADKIKMLASARKEEMLAEAEGIRAKLEAEAQGLEQKVLAQNQISPEVLSQQVIQEIVSGLVTALPEIAEHMKVGDIKWVNMGGNGGDSSPLGIIPKNLIQLVTSLEAFGIDIPGLIEMLLKRTGSDGPSLRSNIPERGEELLLAMKNTPRAKKTKASAGD